MKEIPKLPLVGVMKKKWELQKWGQQVMINNIQIVYLQRGGKEKGMDRIRQKGI